MPSATGHLSASGLGLALRPSGGLGRAGATACTSRWGRGAAVSCRPAVPPPRGPRSGV